MGEYGSTHPNPEKRIKVLGHLVKVVYRPLEDELTRGYILSAITKLHAAMGFAENADVERVMYDFSKSKHVDVQQRAIEYKVLKENKSRVSHDILMNTPLNEA